MFSEEKIPDSENENIEVIENSGSENFGDEPAVENPNTKGKSDISGKIIEEENAPVEKETIFLEPKDIKTKTNIDDERKINYPLFGIVFFCLLVGFLYLIRERKYRKNEFKE